MIPSIIFDILFPMFKKERLNYRTNLENSKIDYKRLISELREKKKQILEEIEKDFNKNENNKEIKNKIKSTKKHFRKEFKNLKIKNKEIKKTIKLNFLSAVSKNKEIRENVKLTKKSKSNLHQILYNYSKLPYDKKKNSLVVQELSPSKEINFSIKEKVFSDLNAFEDKSKDRIYASDKDIVFTSIKLSSGTEKIPIVLKYTGQCVPIFLDRLRDDTFDKFSNENEHHIMHLSERLREIKPPKKYGKIGKKGKMFLIFIVLAGIYLGYQYYRGGF